LKQLIQTLNLFLYAFYILSKLFIINTVSLLVFQEWLSLAYGTCGSLGMELVSFEDAEEWKSIDTFLNDNRK
jgi:hypothetical protein